MSPTELKMQPTIHLRKDNVDICMAIVHFNYFWNFRVFSG
jgi:hypothetical protein